LQFPKHLIFNLIDKIKNSSQTRSDGFQREVERVLALAAHQKKVSVSEAFSYSRSILDCRLLRVEILAAALTILLISIGTSIFIPYSATDILTRFTVISTAMIAGTLVSALVLYLLLPLHLLRNFSLWAVSAIYCFVSSAIFSLIVPETIRTLNQSYPVPTWLEIFVPFLLLIGLADIFILWQLKSQTCLRAFKRRHESKSINALLPTQKRSDVWVISAADHYVEIVTEQGSHLRRMTMKSAIAKTDETEGLRVHRSHWVAYRAMLSLAKESERSFLTLRNGERIPVSSKMAAEVKEYLDSAGLYAAQ